MTKNNNMNLKMLDMYFLDDKIYKKRTLAGLRWLKRSFDVTGTNGSGAYYSRFYKPLSGWQLAYPETTGYIINTLLNFSEEYPDESLEDYSIQSADWICTLQLPNGALPGGFANSKKESVFNSGQMLLGLNAIYRKTSDNKYLQVIEKTVKWLVDSLEENGSWEKGSYIANFIPSYYTRVIWSVLWSNQYLKDNNVETQMKNALSFYIKRICKNKTVADWTFKKNQKAFTHTIAYTIRGFLESALLLNDSNLLQISIEFGDRILKLRELKGKMAGWYDEDWKGSYWFTCLTGNAQLSIILTRLYQITGDIRYLNTSLKLFGDIVNAQKLSNNKNINGAVPGSKPFWGRYLALRYPNWAVKFYLDAYRLLKIETDKLIKSKLF